MQNVIKTFTSPMGDSLRVFVKDGQPWFVGKEVATALGYKNTKSAITAHVDASDKRGARITTPFGGPQDSILINESGLYSLILSSKLPQAKEFKHWVTSEVLPQIRKTGGYIPVSEDDDEKTILCKAVAIMKRTIEQMDALIEAQKPKVLFAEALISSEGSILIRDLAKLITQNGVAIGQNRLFDWMRKHGYIFQHETRPVQKWVEKGLFDTDISLVHTHCGTLERCTTKVTGKGQEYFINGFITGRFSVEDI